MRLHRYRTLGAILACVCVAAGSLTTHPVKLDIPKDWPQPVYDFTRNPLTQEGIALGRKLFHDPILSKDSTISCASCHLSYTAFSHVDHKLSHGIHDSIGTRNAPALMNLAWHKNFMWDGAVNHLDMQPLAPIGHAAEMGETLPHVLFKIVQHPEYRRMFGEAFGDTMVLGDRLLKALAQFQLSLISAGSRYDRMRAGVETFTEQEMNGYRIFRAHCNACHQEPLFTTGGFANNGLLADTVLRDGGRIRITHDPVDSLKFKIPTLRNIEFSYPYMHDGRFRRLNAVIAHYADLAFAEAASVPARSRFGAGTARRHGGVLRSAGLAPELAQPIVLSPNERTDLVAFLLTLSDRDFLLNPDNAAPRNY